MTTALRRAALFLFAAVAFGVITWNLIPQDPPPHASTRVDSYGDAALQASASPPAAGSAPQVGFVSPAPGNPIAATRGATTRDYAIAVAELRGLPPDADVGTRLELWVTWDRPVTRKPRLQRLVPEATLVRIAPPVTPEGPAAAVLRVPTGRISDLLYADGYGALSVTVLS